MLPPAAFPAACGASAPRLPAEQDVKRVLRSERCRHAPHRRPLLLPSKTAALLSPAPRIAQTPAIGRGPLPVSEQSLAPVRANEPRSATGSTAGAIGVRRSLRAEERSKPCRPRQSPARTKDPVWSHSYI